MANRNRNQNNRRNDFGRNDRKSFGNRPMGVSPWQGAAPTPNLSSLLPLAGGSTEATLALANNLISNLLQSQQQQQAVPSLLDMPIRRDFAPNMGNRFNQRNSGYNMGNNRMGNQGNFRRTGNMNRTNDRMPSNNRKQFRPNDGHRQQNRTPQRKDGDYKPKNTKSTPQEPKKDETVAVKVEKDETTKKDEKKDAPKTRYDNIRPEMLKCHICNTSMWDGRSFENHLNGVAHAIMMQKTAESYALTADTMRQEFKIREMKRNRKTHQRTPRDFYCAMCDMYAVAGAQHRITTGHRKLKKYLHPNCALCHKEMPTRIELDEHKLSPEHLSKVPDKKEKAESLVISTLSAELANVRREKRGRNATDDGNEDKNENGDKPEVKSEDQEDQTEEKKEDPEPENLILDFKETDDVSTITLDKIPPYNTERGLGQSYLTEFKCFQCTLCNKLLDTEETAQVHLKTRRHHHLFIRMLKRKAGLLEKPENGKRTSDSEETSDAKRIKTSPEDAENDNEADNDIEHEADNDNEGNADKDNDIYNDIENEIDGDGNGDDFDEMELGAGIPGDVPMEETNASDVQEENGDAAAEEKVEPEPEPTLVEEAEVKEPVVEEVKTPTRVQRATRGRGRGRGTPRGRKS